MGVVGLSEPAWAHGITGGLESIPDFVLSGITHMLLGWDHLLFIVGVVLLAGELRRAASLISLFALGHSTTLIIATLSRWQVNAALVDGVIAASVVFVGVVGLIGRPQRWGWFAAAVTGFGLVHGLGLATRLQALGLHEETVLSRVIAFNIGVEVGQLIAIGVLMLIVEVAHRFPVPNNGALPGWLRTRRAANVALVAGGVLAGTLVAVGAVEQEPATATAAGSGACQVRDRTETFQGIGGHPKKDFYEPTETTPQDDFGHVVGDGYVAVLYQPTLATAQLDELRVFVTGPDGNKVVGGPAAAGQAETFKAIHAYQTLTCTQFDLAALREFKAGWANDPRSRSTG
ncbi:hypothetical protein Air01nite_17960 [Asanoa iriomotensis]|uniref:HupE/UreJ protein n=1 Tax=Asanoa iriomotensis TaxID=234613 RepID=A0ABQ4BYU2_9ACTN|nr:hypothetical protein Air01nite_17960 [Asanoa iriomotensis]